MAEWRNRIIESRMVDAADLKSHPLNPRRHPEGQKRAVAGLLNEIGIVDSLTVYWSAAQESYVVLDGHLRKDMGGMWPVNVLDVTDEEAALILATFDFTTSLAELDSAALTELLARVEMTPVEDEGVRDLLAQLAAANVVEVARGDVDAPAQIDRAAELQQVWGTALGQMWALGDDHRLICGDCTDAAVVARVMGGEKAQMLITDPPYGVDYHGNFIQSGKILADDERIWQGGIKNDDSVDILKDIAGFSPYLLPGGAVIICAPPGRRLFDFLRSWPDEWHFQVAVVWNKQSLIISRWDYHPQHEMVLYGWKEGAAHKWRGGTKQSTVWDIPRHQGSGYDHPTEKPTELYRRAIENHTDAGDWIFEPFCGSGTAIIACEQLGRKCRAVEISPAYVAVALDRFATATGVQPTLLEAA